MKSSRGSSVCLGIESTAHTFGAGIVDHTGRVVANVNSVYRPLPGTGIHPRMAALHHVEVAHHIVKQALDTNPRYTPQVIGFSAGPGLGPCLRIGATVARALAVFFGCPLVSVHHGVAHLDLAISSSKAHDPLAVLVSGGHTAIAVHLGKRWLFYGETQDITLGNLFDMLAREAKLPSPGGVSIENLAEEGRTLLPLPYAIKGNDVSYSGILTAALRLFKRGEKLADICLSVQEVAFSMLAEAVERSLVQTRKGEILLAGGVAANKRLREMLKLVAEDHGASFHPVPSQYSGDCGAQIACSGQWAFNDGYSQAVSSSRVIPRWRLDEVEVSWIPRQS